MGASRSEIWHSCDDKIFLVISFVETCDNDIACVSVKMFFESLLAVRLKGLLKVIIRVSVP